VLYPGEIEHIKEQDRRKNGIDVEDATWARINKLAEDFGVAKELGLGG
jgi:LDH2 family malate/lactate/ureidoglycolate dehydrogenase